MSVEMSKRTISVGGYVFALGLATAVLCEVTNRAGVLIPAAIPVALIPIVGLHFLRPDEELAGWVFFTVALGGTYLAGGAPFEAAGALGIAILAGLGAWRWPWILAATWFGHILWDFVPRELPERMLDVPTACILFDGLIGAYLAWGVYRRRWLSFGGRPQTGTTSPVP